MNTRPMSRLVAPLAAVLVAGCADFNYSRIDGARYHRAEIDTYPLQIVRVDGESAPLNPREPMLVEPGLRTVVVSTYPDALRRFGDEQTMQLQIAPCTHYHLVAVKPTRLAKEYTIRIDYQEPVPGCKPPGAKG